MLRSFFGSISDKGRDQLSQSLLRRLGYYFANNGNYDKSMPLFFELAKKNPLPDSSDVSTLVNLPGASENKLIIEWMIKQAKSSKGEIQVRWLELLNYIKQPQAVIDIIEEAKIE